MNRAVQLGQSQSVSTSSSRSSSSGGTCDAWAVAPGRFDKKVYARLRNKSSAKSFRFPGMCAQLNSKSYWASIKKRQRKRCIKWGFLLVLDFITATTDSLSHKNFTFFFAHSLPQIAPATMIRISSFTAMDNSTASCGHLTWNHFSHSVPRSPSALKHLRSLLPDADSCPSRS